MATLESRGFSSMDADEWRARSSQPHTQEWKADVYKWLAGGGNDPVVLDVPIVGGSLTIDSSEPYRRHLSMEVGGGERWAPHTPNSPLVPFGQRVFLYARIDRTDGTWLPWLKMGEFWITSHTFERPSLIVTIEADDYSKAVDEFLHLNHRSYGGKSLRTAIKQMVDDALPNSGFTIHPASPEPNDRVTSYVAEAGKGRWEAATELAAKFGREVFFDSQGNLIIRHDLTDDQDESIPGEGPDIGTVSNPVAIIKDDRGGNLVGMTATVTREGACNGVAFALHRSLSKKVKKGKKKKNITVDVYRTVTAFAGSSSPVAWGDKFGRVPIVISQDVEKITSELLANRQRRANHLLHRRRGVIRYIDMDCLPLLWLEADDKIRLLWHEGTSSTATREDHFVQRIEFDLTGGAMRLKTRELNVVDPGA
jgi:hypothetical protein